MELKQYYTTIDAHTGGEPLRIITGGIPPLKGDTMLARRHYFREHYDYIRKVLMFEPRGHHGMYGCVITSPVSPDADFGVLFMHNEGFSTMCGHGIIAVVTAAIEMGFLPAAEERSQIIIDTPAGKVIAKAECEGTEVKSVSFLNVPSFVFAQDVRVEALGKSFTIDIAFGGAFYAIVQAEDLGISVDIAELSILQEWGSVIKAYIESHMTVSHPLEPQLQGIYGVIVSDSPQKEGSHLRNVTIFADAQIDRSPCGTGTCARMAALHARGELEIGQNFVHESIVDSQFTGRIMETVKVDEYEAIIPLIQGRAFITGTHQFIVDPSDPLGEGFLLG
ncbi:proline racemase family protein [Paenibacillus alginolyticus]|uniref:Proline racemase family protein n=1 Tax=Paenibacillus alginolyticus TaxID=59839 RepID=A0ABT4GD92_9BACL|nr:proline racemase family protein [Paenibacillus alginolyticus]MCY9694160.1 proline racemase family protein [Paenibacillus alginolyticus]MEC0142371.1 proline racemase family protein [Paenibacillus alginolyticus]